MYMWANRIIVNRKNQVRAGWKIASVVMISIILTVLLEMALHFLSPNKAAWRVISPFIQRVAFILAVLIVLKIIDEKRPRDIGLISFRRGYRDFIAGFILGALAMTVIFFVLWGFGSVSLENRLAEPNWSRFLWSGLLLYIAVGFAEELFFRGYCLNTLLQIGNQRMAIIGSSLIFTLAHFGNPNLTVVGLINIFIVGALLAFMFFKTGNLWMPIGFHIAWNYFQGDVFGFPVSGTVPHGIYNIAGMRGAFWSGGAFGPEGGLLATALIVALFFVIGKYPAKATAEKRLYP